MWGSILTWSPQDGVHFEMESTWGRIQVRRKQSGAGEGSGPMTGLSFSWVSSGESIFQLHMDLPKATLRHPNASEVFGKSDIKCSN